MELSVARNLIEANGQSAYGLEGCDFITAQMILRRMAQIGKEAYMNQAPVLDFMSQTHCRHPFKHPNHRKHGIHNNTSDLMV